MKLFSRSKSDPAAAAATPPPHTGGASAPPATGQAGAGAAPNSGAGSPPAAVEFAAALDTSVKEMSEKIARLTSSVESVHGERQSFEDKLLRMEERMRKLGALTEMISNQYNPFIGDEPADGPGPNGTGDSGVTQLHPVNQSAPALTAPADPGAWASPADSGPLARANVGPETAPFPEPFPEPEEPPMPEEAPLTPPSVEAPSPPPAPAPEAAAPPSLFTPVPDVTAPPAPAGPPPAPPSPWTQASTGPAHLDRIAPTFENHLVTLNWANLLLRHLSFDGLVDILTYYESLGWISRDVKRQIVTYAEGITPPNGSRGSDEWRGNVELHQKSLLFIERLRGLSVDDETYRTLRREITRIAGEDRRV